MYPHLLLGFSFGGILANLCAAHLWSLSRGICQEFLEKNLLCITFGQPIISLPRTASSTDIIADKSRFHAIYISDDIIPRMMRYMDPGYTEFTADRLQERFLRDSTNEVSLSRVICHKYLYMVHQEWVTLILVHTISHGVELMYSNMCISPSCVLLFYRYFKTI